MENEYDKMTVNSKESAIFEARSQCTLITCLTKQVTISCLLNKLQLCDSSYTFETNKQLTFVTTKHVNIS